MKRTVKHAKIRQIKEDGVTVIDILGLDNHPRAFKRAYEQVQKDIQKNRHKFISAGEPMPVIRVLHSYEIH
jgi:TRAP-type C4-dicarboxylate transport system substrate-binding protein